MPSAYEVQIADAIVAELNGRAWSLPFTAARGWLPVYEPADLATVRVTVVPLTLDQQPVARGRDYFDYGLGIDLQRRVDPSDTAQMNAAIDALSYLAQEVHDFYRDTHTLASLSGWQVVDAQRAQIYDLARLYQDHTWETLIALAVKGVRA